MHSPPSPMTLLFQQHHLAQTPHRFRTPPPRRSSSPSYRRHLGASSSEDDEDSLGTDDETPVEPSDYSKVNLIASIQNILSLVNAMKCPGCDLLGSYGLKMTKRLGVSYYISFIYSCTNVIRFVTGNRLQRTPNLQMNDLNMTSILAASLVGVQRRGLEKFFGAMGILPPVQIKSYRQYEQQLFSIGSQGSRTEYESGCRRSPSSLPKRPISPSRSMAPG